MGSPATKKLKEALKHATEVKSSTRNPLKANKKKYANFFSQIFNKNLSKKLKDSKLKKKSPIQLRNSKKLLSRLNITARSNKNFKAAFPGSIVNIKSSRFGKKNRSYSPKSKLSTLAKKSFKLKLNGSKNTDNSYSSQNCTYRSLNHQAMDAKNTIEDRLKQIPNTPNFLKSNSSFEKILSK